MGQYYIMYANGPSEKRPYWHLLKSLMSKFFLGPMAHETKLKKSSLGHILIFNVISSSTSPLSPC
jgi:hypothetical protein